MHRDRVVSEDELLERPRPGRIVGEALLTSWVKVVRQIAGERGREQRVMQTLHRPASEGLEERVAAVEADGYRRHDGN